jgi:hypothetical protein
LGGEHAIPTFSKLVVPNIDLRPVSWEFFKEQSRKPEKAMSDNILKMVIVTVVALIGLAVWTMRGQVEQGECLNNCATDFSASGR